MTHKDISADEWANLSLMNDEDIDYSLLPEDVLKKLALGNEFYIATSALMELWVRESSATAPLAWEILSNSHGDRYLQATALRVLFRTNKEKALDYMIRQAQECDIFVLNEMMQLIVENPSDFTWAYDSSVVRIIFEQLKKLEDEQELIDKEVRDSFLKLYGSVKIS